MGDDCIQNNFMNCDHDFIRVSSPKALVDGKESVKAVCVYCGQVRALREDGLVVIIKDYGTVTNKNATAESKDVSKHP